MFYIIFLFALMFSGVLILMLAGKSIIDSEQ